jgi:hypothetical protein
MHEGENDMKIAVLNCSPKGKRSLTFTSFKYLERMEQADSFTDYFVGDGKLPMDAVDSIDESDIIVLTSSLFHSGIHAQMFNLLDSIAEKISRENKVVTYFITSNCIGDEEASRMVSDFFNRNGFNYVEGLSLHTEDVREEHIREAMYRWFEHIKTMHTLGDPNLNIERLELTEKRNVVILNTADKKDVSAEKAAELARVLALDYKARGFEVKYVDLNDYKILPCTACCACYTNCTCVMNSSDDFTKALDDIYKGTDLVVLMGTVKYGALGYIYKKFLDRHVQFGRIPPARETVWNLVYIGETTELDLRDFDYHVDSFFSYLRDIYVGSYNIESDEDKVKIIDKTVSLINNEVYPHMSQYRDALDEKFGRLAFELQNMCVNDYKYYKNTFYSKPLEVNEFVQPYESPQTALNSQKMRVFALEQCLKGVDPFPKFTKRRRYKNLSFGEGVLQRNEDIDTGKIPEDTPTHLNKKPAGMQFCPPSGASKLPFDGPPPWVMEGRAPTPEEIQKYGLTGPPPGMGVPPVDNETKQVEKPKKPVFNGPPPWVLEHRPPTPEEIKEYGLTGPPPGVRPY